MTTNGWICLALILILPVLSTGGLATTDVNSNCQRDLAEALGTVVGLPYIEFDQTMNAGWRQLADKGCYGESADLIEAYIAANGSVERSLVWHVAQMRAYTGDYEQAIVFAKKSLRETEDLDVRKLRWNDYVRATVAFLERGKKNLIRFRNEVAAGISDYVGNENNTRVLDALIDNFELSYANAISRIKTKDPD